jgi:signal transduction histidine kinase
LTRARLDASRHRVAVPVPLLESIEAIVRTLERLYTERRIAFDVRVADDIEVLATGDDLEEILGNVLDNACQWASTRVVLTATAEPPLLRITVDDDGSGLDPAMREPVLKRGVRADEASPGTGLGLAIVRDLVELYGGSVSLDRSPLGGLRAVVRLPG